MADTIDAPAPDAGYDTDFYLVESEWETALREATRKLHDDEKGTRNLKLVYLTLMGPNAAHVLDPDHFPEPIGSE